MIKIMLIKSKLQYESKECITLNFYVGMFLTDEHRWNKMEVTIFVLICVIYEKPTKKV